jgi:hypothetical protein
MESVMMMMESMMVVERIAAISMITAIAHAIARVPSKSHPIAHAITRITSISHTVTWIHSVPRAKELSIHFSSPPHIVLKVVYVSMFKKG